MEIINELKKLNFTEAEAKVYISLLKYGPSTGYEISKNSGIARSKIYNHLEKLVKDGVIEAFTGEKTLIYQAISTEELIKLSKKTMNQRLEKFEYLAENLPRIDRNQGIWEIENYNRVLLKAEELISKAEKSLYIQIWVDELDKELEKLINNKMDKLDKSLVILYDKNQKYKTSLEKFYAHGFEMERLEDMSQRWITIVADDEYFLYSGILFNNESSGIYGKDKILSFFAKEYVQHDAYSLKLIEDFRKEIVDKYGQDMKGIRDIFK